MASPSPYGRLLASARDHAAITQGQLASALGVGRSVVALVETGGRRTLAARHDARAAELLGLPPSALAAARAASAAPDRSGGQAPLPPAGGAELDPDHPAARAAADLAAGTWPLSTAEGRLAVLEAVGIAVGGGTITAAKADVIIKAVKAAAREEAPRNDEGVTIEWVFPTTRDEAMAVLARQEAQDEMPH